MVDAQESSEGWELVDHPYDLSNTEFRDVEFINSTHGWVVGGNGTDFHGGIVLHTTDGGETWDLQLYNSSQYFRQIAVIDDQTVWVSGFGSLFYSLDGGQSWNESVVVGGTSGMSTVAFINRTHGWTATVSTLYKTEDMAVTWEPVPGWSFGWDMPKSIHFISSTEAWAIGYAGIYYSSDGCETWTQRHDQGGWGFSFVDDVEAWAVADDMLAHMVDGETWTELALPRKSPFPYPTPPYFTDILFLDENHGWIVGSEVAVLYTPNGGLDWYDQTAQLTEELKYIHRVMAVDFINLTHGWAVGANGNIFRTTHGDYLGPRLFYGLTDPIFLRDVGMVVAVIVVLPSGLLFWRRRKRRARLRRAPTVTDWGSE
jgi:photosystem II stability/assembly factor-like uncharacterized protein